MLHTWQLMAPGFTNRLRVLPRSLHQLLCTGQQETALLDSTTSKQPTSKPAVHWSLLLCTCPTDRPAGEDPRSKQLRLYLARPVSFNPKWTHLTVTAAACEMRLTAAFCTPGCCVRIFLTDAEHPPHIIPLTSSMIVCCCGAWGCSMSESVLVGAKEPARQHSADSSCFDG